VTSSVPSEAIIFSVGTAAGTPNQTVTLYVNLDNQSNAPAAGGFGFDITFDDSVLSNPTAAATDLMNDPSVAKSVSGNESSAGVFSVIAFGLNQNVIPTGDVVELTFDINSGASPQTVGLGITTISASTPGLQGLETAGVDGSITVQ